MLSIAVSVDAPKTRSAASKRRFLARLVAVLTGGMILDGYILGILGPVTNAIKADLGMSTLATGLVASAALFGILIGSPLGGWAGDRIGRRPLFLTDMGLLVMTSAMQFFVDSATSLFIVRLLMGIAIGTEYSVGWPLMSEFSPARLRGRLMGFTVLAWFIGFMLGYMTGYVLSIPEPLPWRIILGTSTVIAAVLFVTRIGLPESPRWLWSKGRKDEARAVALKYLESADDTTDMEKELSRQGRFMDLFSKRHWRTTVFVSWFWFCNVLPYFAIATFAENVLAQYGLSGGLAGGVGLSMVAVVGVVFTIALIDKAGRRLFTVPPQWITVAIFLVIGLWSNAPSPIVLALFLLFSFLNAMNATLTSIYPGEVFPTEVRCIGTGFAAAISRVGAGMGTFLLPIGMEKYGVSIVMLVAAFVVLSSAVVSQMWAPETKGRSLSETAAGYST